MKVRHSVYLRLCLHQSNDEEACSERDVLFTKLLVLKFISFQSDIAVIALGCYGNHSRYFGTGMTYTVIIYLSVKCLRAFLPGTYPVPYSAVGGLYMSVQRAEDVLF